MKENMVTKKLLLAISFCLGLEFTQAQTYKFSDEPGQFITDIHQMMEATKYEVAIMAAVNFDSAWVSLTDDQKVTLISIAQKMAKRRLKPIPHFQDLFNTIYYAIYQNFYNPTMTGDTMTFDTSRHSGEKIDSQTLDLFLTMMYKFIDIPENDNTSIANFLVSTRLFFEKKALYDSNFSSVFVNGGTYYFDYIGPKEEKKTTDKEETIEKGIDWGDDDWGWNDYDVIEDFTDDKNENDVVVNGDTRLIQPQIEGAVIIFKNINVFLRTNFGTSIIKSTNGTYSFKNNIFVGDSGKFDWSSVGILPSELYCEFKKYNFNVKSTVLKADSVTLHYPELIDSPIKGVFEFQSKRYSDPFKAQYPKFMSYSNNIKIKNFGENMIYAGGLALIYRGGLTLAGRRLNSSSVAGGNCEIKFIGKNILKIRLISKRFELGDSLIASKRAHFALYLYEDSLLQNNKVVFRRKDSIVHPLVKLKYNKNTAMLKLLTGGSKLKHRPFSDSYHNIDFRAELLHWDLTTPYVNFSVITARSDVPALFESREYYDPIRFKRMQGVMSFHPLKMVVMYGRLKGKKEFYVDQIAKDYKKNPNTIKSTCALLSKQGFIDYNAFSGLIKLKPKGIHYVFASMGKSDFDNMLLISLIASKDNATLDLTNNQLTVRGISKFYLSDSMRVFVIPQNNEIKILRDRNLLFAGMIRAGNLLFFGHDFKFDYEGFFVALKSVDSLKFRLDAVGILDNQMVFKGGILYINKPNNRSGRRNFPEYPKLTALDGGYVYFDRKKVLNKAYDRRMYFHIPAFELDSLNSYDPSSFSFHGTFYSGGIFPPFQEVLRIMPDYSLGFTHTIPYNGYNVYGKDDARFYNRLTLNNEGLRGPGEIKYMTATFKSEDFIFYLDSVLAEATGGLIQGGSYNQTTFPQTTYSRCLMKWMPETGMYLSNTDFQIPIELYDKKATLDGTTVLNADGLFGIGMLESSGSMTISDEFQFKENNFTARRATFKIASNNPGKPALLCTAVKLDFNMQNQFAEWSPEIAGFPSTEFPYAQYKTSIEKGKLDLIARIVYMNMPEGSDIKNSYFYSTHPDQDSLAFNATDAIYDMNELELDINGIPEIRVSDVFIIPDKNNITVLENARIPMLTRAEIIMDTLHQFHKLHSGNIIIHSRNEFEGNAIYDFVNLANDTFKIKFDKFVMGKKAKKKKDIVYTAALGKILEEDSISISPRIFYKGKVELHANKDNMDVDGFVKLQMIGIFKSDNWFKYVNKEDIFKVFINVEDLVSAEGKPLSTGLHIDQRSSNLYSTFISEKRVNTDLDVLPVKGVLYIDPYKSEFKIAPSEKIAGQTYQGNVMVYHDLISSLDYEGKLKMVKTRNDNKDFICESSGNGSAYFSSYDTLSTTDTLLTINLARYHELIQLYDTLFIIDTVCTKEKLFYLTSQITSKGRVSQTINNLNYIIHLKRGDTLLWTAKNIYNIDTLLVLDPQLNPDTLFTTDTIYGERSRTVNPVDTLLATSFIIDTIATNQYEFNTFLSFDFGFPSQALKLISKDVSKSITESLPNFNDSTLIYRLAEIIGNEKAKEYKYHLSTRNSTFLDYKYTALYTFSNKLNKSIVFSDVDLKWSNEYKTWYSVGELGLSNVLKSDINSKVVGYIEISKTLSGDKVDIYIEFSDNKWYYFHYDNTTFWYKMRENMPINKLMAVSSNSQFNEIVGSKSKGDIITEDKYVFILGDLMDKALFIRKFKSKYLGEGIFEEEDNDEEEIDEEIFDDSEIIDMRIKAREKKPKKKGRK